MQTLYEQIAETCFGDCHSVTPWRLSNALKGHSESQLKYKFVAALEWARDLSKDHFTLGRINTILAPNSASRDGKTDISPDEV